MNDRREDVLQEVTLFKNPSKINRLGKKRRTQCKGGCGRRVWDDYCRKCRRKMAREGR